MPPGRPPATPPPGRTDAVLSSSRLAELRDVVGEEGGRLFRQLIDIFHRDVPERIGEIQAASGAARVADAQAAAHRLKSGAANLGLTRLQELCQALEDTARSKESSKLRELARELEPRYREAAAAIEAWYAREFG